MAFEVLNIWQVAKNEYKHKWPLSTHLEWCTVHSIIARHWLSRMNWTADFSHNESIHPNESVNWFQLQTGMHKYPPRAYKHLSSPFWLTATNPNPCPLLQEKCLRSTQPRTKWGIPTKTPIKQFNIYSSECWTVTYKTFPFTCYVKLLKWQCVLDISHTLLHDTTANCNIYCGNSVCVSIHQTVCVCHSRTVSMWLKVTSDLSCFQNPSF